MVSLNAAHPKVGFSVPGILTVDYLLKVARNTPVKRSGACLNFLKVKSTGSGAT